MQRLAQSPRQQDFVQNPYPFYDRSRNAGPLFFWEDYDMVCAAGYEAVSTILKDRRFGREAPECVRKPVPERLRPFFEIETNSMLEREPPTHTQLRAEVMRYFTGRNVHALEPSIKALAHELIESFPKEPFDLLPAFAEKLPVITIARMLGVPDAMADQLLSWSHAMVAMYQSRRNRHIEDEAVRAATQFSAYVSELIQKKRMQNEDDLLSALVNAGEDARLSEPQIISTAILLLNAGHEATVHTIGNGVACLLSRGFGAEIFTDETAANAISTEILRFDPPLHMFTRYALGDVEIYGHRFKEGEQVGLMLASANRDETQFDNAHEFQIDREPRTNMSLGAGIHFCVGAPLARLELNLALPILFKSCPELRLTEAPVYADRYHFHGFEKLMVSVA